MATNAAGAAKHEKSELNLTRPLTIPSSVWYARLEKTLDVLCGSHGSRHIPEFLRVRLENILGDDFPNPLRHKEKTGTGAEANVDGAALEEGYQDNTKTVGASEQMIVAGDGSNSLDEVAQAAKDISGSVSGSDGEK